MPEAISTQQEQGERISPPYFLLPEGISLEKQRGRTVWKDGEAQEVK